MCMRTGESVIYEALDGAVYIYDQTGSKVGMGLFQNLKGDS